MKERGFTLIELLVVISIIATLVGMVTILIPRGHHMAHRHACMKQVSELVGVLETVDTRRYPPHGGATMLLYLVNKGMIGGKDGLAILFCPGDQDETLEDAGGVAAYDDIDLKQAGRYGHLTSYAARSHRERKCRARKSAVPAQVLIADDSDDHHDGRGIVIGLTGGTAKWRDLVDDYGLSKDADVTVGEGSNVEELTCLRAD